jgi:hypothetical protein
VPQVSGDGFAPFVTPFRLGLGDAFPLPFEHHFPFELGDSTQHGLNLAKAEKTAK